MSADNREEAPEISFYYLAASKVALDDVCERAAVVKRVYGAVNAEVDLFLISYVDRQLLFYERNNRSKRSDPLRYSSA